MKQPSSAQMKKLIFVFLSFKEMVCWLKQRASAIAMGSTQPF